MILKMALFLSGLGHDLDHPGTTNDFQSQAKTKISIKYLDESNIEMHSLCLFFKILNNTKIFNPISEKKESLFNNLTNDELLILREFIIFCVIRTDPRFHSHFIDSFTHIKEKRIKDKTAASSFNLRKLDIKDSEEEDKIEVNHYNIIYIYYILFKTLYIYFKSM